MFQKNGLELSITKARKEDAGQIIEYLNQIGGESDNLLFGENGFHMSVEDEEKYIGKVNSSRTSALFVGKIVEEIVCVGTLQSSQRERIAHQADLAISVKKRYWNCGIGTELMKTMIGFAKGNGITEIIHLAVRADNVNAIQLYHKMGFEDIGVFKKAIKLNGMYHDNILMNLYLS